MACVAAPAPDARAVRAAKRARAAPKTPAPPTKSAAPAGAPNAPAPPPAPAPLAVVPPPGAGPHWPWARAPREDAIDGSTVWVVDTRAGLSGSEVFEALRNLDTDPARCDASNCAYFSSKEAAARYAMRLHATRPMLAQNLYLKHVRMDWGHETVYLEALQSKRDEHDVKLATAAMPRLAAALRRYLDEKDAQRMLLELRHYACGWRDAVDIEARMRSDDGAIEWLTLKLSVNYLKATVDNMGGGSDSGRLSVTASYPVDLDWRAKLFKSVDPTTTSDAGEARVTAVCNFINSKMMRVLHGCNL